MEAAVAEGKTEAEYRFGSWMYTVYWHDPGEMVQMNMATGTLRAVRRTPPLTAEPLDAPAAGGEAAAAAGAAAGALPPWLSAEDDRLLSEMLLCPAAATENPAAPVAGSPESFADAQLLDLLRRHVPGVDEMLDRTGRTPVATYVIATYHNGLPSFKDSAPLQAHTIHALRSIFAMVVAEKHGAAVALRSVAAAFQSCQAEQGRTIDAQFGRLNGRDATFKEQLLALVDQHKQMVMQAAVCTLNPTAAEMGDGAPSKQVPHITSAYLQAVGTEFGFRGVMAANKDVHAPPLAPVTVARVKDTVRQLFSVAEVVEAFVEDVNQQHEGAERVISRDDLAAYVASPEGAAALGAAMEAQAKGSKAGGRAAAARFDPHSIFYDEASPDASAGAVGGYGESKPSEANRFQPFLCPRVAVILLLAVVLH